MALIGTILYWIGLGIAVTVWLGWIVWVALALFGGGELGPAGYSRSSVEHLPTDRHGNH